MRLRRLCLLILVFRLFLSEPMSVWTSVSVPSRDDVIEVGNRLPTRDYRLQPKSRRGGQITTLLSGYSMIPSAPSALS